MSDSTWTWPERLLRKKERSVVWGRRCKELVKSKPVSFHDKRQRRPPCPGKGTHASLVLNLQERPGDSLPHRHPFLGQHLGCLVFSVRMPWLTMENACYTTVIPSLQPSLGPIEIVTQLSTPPMRGQPAPPPLLPAAVLVRKLTSVPPADE